MRKILIYRLDYAIIHQVENRRFDIECVAQYHQNTCERLHNFLGESEMKTRMRNVMLGAMLMILLTTSFGYADLNAGLVAYYPFNGNANDETGHGHNGTVNGASLTTDRFGNPSSAYVFNGGYIDVADAPDLNPTDAITITAWFKATSFHYGSYSWPNIVTKRDHDGAPTRGYCMEIQEVYSSNPCVGFSVNLEGGGAAGGPVGLGPFTPQLEENTWYFAAGVYDGSTATVYVGPSVAYSGNYSGNIAPASDNLWIGNAPVYGDRSFDGIIDEVRIYNRALLECEIQQLAGSTIEATVDIDPDTLNLDSQDKWVTCYIELSECFDVIDIDGATVMLDGIPAYIGKEGWARAGANTSNIIDHDGDGILERMVKFDCSDVKAMLIDLGMLGNVELMVSGELIGGTWFEGTDVIRVINKGN